MSNEFIRFWTMRHTNFYLFIFLACAGVLATVTVQDKQQHKLDQRCAVSHNLSQRKAIGRCDNGRLLCRCLCPSPSKEFRDECCPPYSVTDTIDDTEILEDEPVTFPNKTCILFRAFDCFRNMTSTCLAHKIIIDNFHNCHSTFQKHLRSFTLSPNCFFIRKTLESLCPPTPPVTVLTVSGNIDNMITMTDERFECQCDIPPPVITSTVKPPPTPDPSPSDFGYKYLYVVVASAGIIVFLLVTILATVACKRNGRHHSVVDDDRDQLIPRHRPAFPDSLHLWRSSQPLRLLSFTPVGRGRFGVVYKVEQTLLKKIVALKRISIFSVNSDMSHFLREINHLAEIENDHVVKLYDCWVENPQGNVETDDGWLNPDPANLLDYVLFLQMEFCDSDLDKVLRCQKTFESREKFINFSSLVRHLTSGLEAIHKSGIIHRDIKPGNVLYTQVDKDGRKIWKIGDLGLSRGILDDGALTMAGTTPYMSPEMLHPEQGVYTEVTDVFSLGLTLLESMCPSLLDVNRKTQEFASIKSSPLQERAQLLDTLLQHLPNNLVLEGRVVRQMLELDPALRPNVFQICDKLHA